MRIPSAKGESSTEERRAVKIVTTRLTSRLKTEVFVEGVNQCTIYSEKVNGLGDTLAQFLEMKRPYELKGANYRDVLNILANGVIS